MSLHSVHIPVMGTAFTIDAPLKVARFGISSVISIGDNELCEVMRKFHSEKRGLEFVAIDAVDDEYRWKRIKAYLDLVQDIVDEQVGVLKTEAFGTGSEIDKYFEILPDGDLRDSYFTMLEMPEGDAKAQAQNALRGQIVAGNVDANIMTKLDRENYSLKDKSTLGVGYSDALSNLKGFALSRARGNIVFSAGFNRRLYAFLENFEDFYADENGVIKKGIVMKVSDFRSSQIQGRFLAKKGIWISEHRIESGLNCGGHAFATDGLLAGPIMKEFQDGRDALDDSLRGICNKELKKLGKPLIGEGRRSRVTYQGGLGTGKEDAFVRTFYDLDGTGWASPFLVVPEVSLLDDETRAYLAQAGRDEFILSDFSPLGIPFNCAKGTMSEGQKLERIQSGRPGSPCPKAHLVSNLEFTKKPICTASVLYQRRKLEELEVLKPELSDDLYDEKYQYIVGKACLCEDLAAGALIKGGMENGRPLKTAVCAGPNLAYFSRILTMKEIMGHIYDRISVLNESYRANFLVNELKMYIEHIEKEVKKSLPQPNEKQIQGFLEFRDNLMNGIDYYRDEVVPAFVAETQQYRDDMGRDLMAMKARLEGVVSRYSQVF